jgi:hypothetical protein
MVGGDLGVAPHRWLAAMGHPHFGLGGVCGCAFGSWVIGAWVIGSWVIGSWVIGSLVIGSWAFGSWLGDGLNCWGSSSLR